MEDVYARFAEAINRPGSIYRVTVLMEISAEQSSAEATTTTRILCWAQPGATEDRQHCWHRARSVDFHYRQRLGIQALRATAPGRALHQGRGVANLPRRQRGCLSGLRCPGRTAESTTTLDTGEYEGRHAVILVTSGTNHGSDETTTFTDRFYLDASTMLPIAAEEEGDSGEMHYTGLYTYQNDFVPADSLP